MGLTLVLDFPELYTFLDLYNEIENIIKKKIPQKEKEITKIIANFLMSDKYMIFCKTNNNVCKEKNLEHFSFLLKIILMCEINEKYLSVKILFPLIEELKLLKFENQLDKVKKIDGNNIISTYLKNNKDSIDKLKDSPKNIKIIESFKSNDRAQINFFLYSYFIYIFSFFFENEEWRLKYKDG
jgi:hypothetical protein